MYFGLCILTIEYLHCLSCTNFSHVMFPLIQIKLELNPQPVLFKEHHSIDTLMYQI